MTDKKVITPKDLPDFGSLPDHFVATESKIIMPKVVTKDSPLEDLETPDQLEERATKAAEDQNAETLVTATESKEQPFVVKGKNFKAIYPNWEPDLETQIVMFHELIRLAQYELHVNQERMDNIEIMIHELPLLVTNVELNEMRKLILRNVEIQAEIGHYSEQCQVRADELAAIEKAKAGPKAGFWKKLFTGKLKISIGEKE